VSIAWPISGILVAGLVPLLSLYCIRFTPARGDLGAADAERQENSINAGLSSVTLLILDQRKN